MYVCVCALLCAIVQMQMNNARHLWGGSHTLNIAFEFCDLASNVQNDIICAITSVYAKRHSYNTHDSDYK